MLIPVILSGGSGSRLWPISRASFPKPFIKTPDGVSLLQKTFTRIKTLHKIEEVIIVTNRDYYFLTRNEINQVNKQSELKYSYLFEPVGRNTAPAILMAALKAKATYGDRSTLLILPADHLISNLDSFQDAVNQAVRQSNKAYLVTFGIQPDSANTGFGYIRCGKNLSPETSLVEEFLEKPDLKTAQLYLKSGKYLWNSGMFCFQTQQILKVFESNAPQLFEQGITCWEKSKKCNNLAHAHELDPELFSEFGDMSIDYAVMETSTNRAVVHAKFDWNDIGSWSALSELYKIDKNSNRIRGETVLKDVKNSYIDSPDRLVGAIGINNLAIIDTPDALLVANQDRLQDVKHIFQILKEQNHPAYKDHKKVSPPWGSYTILAEGNDYKVKLVEINPESQLTLQMHYHRSEHWIVLSGTATIINGDDHMILKSNESAFIPQGQKHRLKNEGKTLLVIIEVQSGQYIEEDDIVRFNVDNSPLYD